MSNISVDIDAIVKHIGKNISFLQPVYEAIVNSLEANADTIKVEFFRDTQLTIKGKNDKLNSFRITDNGEGFNEDNVKSFNKLWSNHKVGLGCKGSGRFTWLNVFQNIDIISELPQENKIVQIHFSKNYGENDISIKTDASTKNQQTIITFTNITEQIYNSSKSSKGTIDLRESADLDAIYSKLFDYLLVKLFLLKRKNRNFCIELVLENHKKIINNSNIPQLESKQFSIPTGMKNCKYGENIDFDLYYYFKCDKSKSKKAYYCAHERTVKKIDDDGLGFSASLPNDDSFIVLLCSNYFDDNVNEDRDRFDGLEGADLKHRNLIYPILLGDIKQ